MKGIEFVPDVDRLLVWRGGLAGGWVDVSVARLTQREAAIARELRYVYVWRRGWRRDGYVWIDGVGLCYRRLKRVCGDGRHEYRIGVVAFVDDILRALNAQLAPSARVEGLRWENGDIRLLP